MPSPTTKRPLVIIEPTGINRDNWPVTGGVPFGQGELHDLGAVRILAEDDTEIPAQVWELCRWPDGSLRWAGVHIEVNVPRQGRRDLTLEFGAGVARSEPEAQVQVAEDAEAIHVSTNVLRLELAKAPLSLRASLADGTKLIAPAESDGFWVVDAAGKRFRACVTDVEIERAGPLHALLRLTGAHLAEADASLFDFMLRLHVFANAPWAQLEYTFINREDEPLDVELSGIVFQASLSADAASLATCGAYRALHQTAEGLIIDLGIPRNLTGIYPNARVLRPDGESTGVTAHGWADFSGPGGGVTIALRDYSENFPKRTVALEGKLQMHFWPAQAGPLRFHQGMAKTHVMMVCLRPDDDRDGRPTRSDDDQDGRLTDGGGLWASRMAHGFNERLVFTPQPWYLETMVFGEVFPYLPHKYPQIERRMRDEFIGWEDGNRSLGMMDWGDFPQFGMEGRERFMGNNEHDFMHVVLLQWMRTGERKLLRALDASIYHTMDIDRVHHCTKDPWQVGGIRTHADDHWNYAGTQYTSPSHMWAEGLAEYACLFVDRRALETARGICDLIVREIGAGARYLGGERTAGWACISLIPTYEATGDSRYLETARRILHDSMGEQNEDGSFCFPLGFADTKCPYLMTQYAAGIRHYLRVADDKAARECFLRICRWRLGESHFEDGAPLYWSHWDYRRSRSGGDMRGPLGYAWALTGDLAFIEYGMRDHERCFSGYGSEMLNIWAWGINHVTDHVCTIMGHTIAMNWQGNLRFMYWADKAGLLRDIQSP